MRKQTILPVLFAVLLALSGCSGLLGGSGTPTPANETPSSAEYKNQLVNDTTASIEQNPSVSYNWSRSVTNSNGDIEHTLTGNGSTVANSSHLKASGNASFSRPNSRNSSVRYYEDTGTTYYQFHREAYSRPMNFTNGRNETLTIREAYIGGAIVNGRNITNATLSNATLSAGVIEKATFSNSTTEFTVEGIQESDVVFVWLETTTPWRTGEREVKNWTGTQMGIHHDILSEASVEDIKYSEGDQTTEIRVSTSREKISDLYGRLPGIDQNRWEAANESNPPVIQYSVNATDYSIEEVRFETQESNINLVNRGTPATVQSVLTIHYSEHGATEVTVPGNLTRAGP